MSTDVKYEPKPPASAASSDATEKPRPPSKARGSTYCALTNPRRALAILLRDTVNPAQAADSSQTELSDGASIVSHVKSRFRTRMILNEIFSVKDVGTLAMREAEFRDVITGNELRQRNNIHTTKLEAIRVTNEQAIVIEREWRERELFAADEQRFFAASIAVDGAALQEFTARCGIAAAYPPDSLIRQWWALHLRHMESYLEPYGRFDLIAASEAIERDESFVRYQIDLDITLDWLSLVAEATTAMVVDARTVAALKQQRMAVESREILVRDELMSHMLHELYNLNFDALRALRLAPSVDVSGTEATRRRDIADLEQREFAAIVSFSLRHAQHRRHCTEQDAIRESESLCRNATLTDEEERWFKLLRRALHEWHDTYVQDCAGLDDRKQFDAVEHRARVDITRQFLSECLETLAREESQRNGIRQHEWQRSVLFERFIDGFLALQQQEFIYLKNITKAFQVALMLTKIEPLASLLAKQENLARFEVELVRDEQLARFYKPWVGIRTAFEDEPKDRQAVQVREQTAWSWLIEDFQTVRFIDSLQQTALEEGAARSQVERDQASGRRIVSIARYQWFCENRFARDNEQIAQFEETEDAYRVHVEDAEIAARATLRVSGLVTFALADRSAIFRRERDARALVNASILINVEKLCRASVHAEEIAERVPLVQSSIHDTELVSRVHMQAREQSKFDALLKAVNAPHPLILAFEAWELRERLSIMFDAEVSLNADARNARLRTRVDYRSASVIHMFAKSAGETVDEYYEDLRRYLEYSSELDKRIQILLDEQYTFAMASLFFTEALQRIQIHENEMPYFAIFEQSRHRVEAEEIQYSDDLLMRAVDNVETGMRNDIDISSRIAVLSLLSAADEHYVAQRKRLIQRIIEEQQVVIEKYLIGCIVVADEEAGERVTVLHNAYMTLKAQLAVRPPMRFAVSLHSIQLSLTRSDMPESLDEAFSAVINVSNVTTTTPMHISKEITGGLTHIFVLSPTGGESDEASPSPPSFIFDLSMKSVRVYAEIRRGGRLMCHDTLVVEDSALDGGVLSFVMSSEQCNFAKVIFLANVQ